MTCPRVFIDTNVLKFSATALRRFRPRKQTINWAGLVQEMTVYDLVTVNRNERIRNEELKAEADLLPKVADAAKSGEVELVIQMEARFESWGLRNMDSQSGTLYGAPIRDVDAPVRYSRVLIGGQRDSDEMQFDFLAGLTHPRFLELQKVTGAFQGKRGLNRNQLLDAFHLWCAEFNECAYFLTLDFKLAKMVRQAQDRASINVKAVRPSELLAALHGADERPKSALTRLWALLQRAG